MKQALDTISKKDQILSLFSMGIRTVEELATLSGTTPTYVATVLRTSDLLAGYFDLYTTTKHPMNVYSKFFANRLGFKDIATARRSIQYIDYMYRQFAQISDRAGQHHTMLMALTMYNRARWVEKFDEAEVFRRWLTSQLLAEAEINRDHDIVALPHRAHTLKKRTRKSLSRTLAH